MLSVQSGEKVLPALPVFLDDDGPYYFTPRKVIQVVLDIRELGERAFLGEPIRDEVTRRQDDWLRKGFGKKQWKHIAARRADSKDPLTQDHVDLIYDVLVAQATQMLKAI